MTRIITLSQNIAEKMVIDEVCSVLENGGVVVFPSDTVYALLADATNHNAVKKLIGIKNRPPGKPISIFIHSTQDIPRYAETTDEKMSLLTRILPGPFTVVLPSKHQVDPLLESEKGGIGIRVPCYDRLLHLAQAYKKPITATSANLAGRSPHYSVDSLLNTLPSSKKCDIDLFIDGGILPRNKPSSVIDLSEDTVRTLREGDISIESSDTNISHSPEETQKIGHEFMSKVMDLQKNHTLVFILKGTLGAGKTEMTKGMASVFGLQNIISPTFVVSYEYDCPENKKFLHTDLYNIQEEEELSHLGIDRYMKKGNILVFEWGEKLGSLYTLFSKHTKLYLIDISILDTSSRKITTQSITFPA